MSKMREALFKQWLNDDETFPLLHGDGDDLAAAAFEAGYQAAIAAVKEGGVCGFIGQHTSGTPLYKLPEDTP